MVSFVRAPVGQGTDEMLGNFVIPAGPYYALAPPDPLAVQSSIGPAAFMLADGSGPALLRVWADANFASLMGTARPEDDGSWPRDDLQLANLETPYVYVTAIDEAGNESDPVQIQTSWWVATTAADVVTAEPKITTRALDALNVTDYEEVLKESELIAADGSQRQVRSSYHWRMRMPVNSLPPRVRPLMVTDAARGRIVMFGGEDVMGGGIRGDTWEWDGSGWNDVTPVQDSPMPREGYFMVYDSQQGETLLLGRWLRGRLVLGWRGLECLIHQPKPPARWRRGDL